MNNYWDYAKEHAAIVHTVMNSLQSSYPKTLPSIMHLATEQYLKHIIRGVPDWQEKIEPYYLSSRRNLSEIKKGNVPGHTILTHYRIVKALCPDYNVPLNVIDDIKRYYFDGARYPEWEKNYSISDQEIKNIYSSFQTFEKESTIYILKQEIKEKQAALDALLEENDLTADKDKSI